MQGQLQVLAGAHNRRGRGKVICGAPETSQVRGLGTKFRSSGSSYIERMNARLFDISNMIV